MGRGGIQVCRHPVHLLYIATRQQGCEFRVPISHRKGDDPALLLLFYVRASIQLLARVLVVLLPVMSAQIESFHQTILDGPALQYCRKEGSWSLQTQQAGGIQAQSQAGAAASGRSTHQPRE